MFFLAGPFLLGGALDAGTDRNEDILVPLAAGEPRAAGVYEEINP